MPLKLVKRKGSGHYYVRGAVRGQRVYETCGTDNQEAAEAIRIRRESQLLHQSVFGVAAPVTFAKAAVSYLESGGEAKHLGTFDSKTGRWTSLLGQFQETPVGKIGQVEADEAALKLCPTAGPATRRRHVYGPLCAVLNHAAGKGWCGRPVIKGPKVKPTAVKWATPDWFAKVLPHCGPRLRRLLVVLAYTGPRLSEALRLDWDADVNLSERTLVFRRTKNGEMRTGHVSDPLLTELALVPEAQRHGKMFPWADKCHVYRPLRTACRRAGVPYLSPHQLGRHTYATWLRLYAKRDLRGVMEDGGWKSINAVIRYSHVVPGETAKAVDLLPTVIVNDANVKPIKDKRIRLRRP